MSPKDLHIGGIRGLFSLILMVSFKFRVCVTLAKLVFSAATILCKWVTSRLWIYSVFMASAELGLL